MSNIKKVYISAATVTGSRAHNQDNMLLWYDGQAHLLPSEHGTEVWEDAVATGLVLAVFDGCGGLRMGELASYHAAFAMGESLNRTGIDGLEQAMLCADGAVCALAQAFCGEGELCGSTASAVRLSRTGELFLLNLGDSPCFLLREGRLRLLSEVQNEAARKAALGGLPTPEDGASLTACLGMPEDSLPFGLREEVLAQRMGRRSLPLRDGDILVLCSDGITRHFSQQELEGLLTEGRTARRLAEEAAAVDGSDNCTLLTAKIVLSES